MKTLTDIFQSIQERKKNVEVIQTGFMELDQVLDGGFFKQETIILGGRTGSGKSFFSTALFRNIASQGFSSAYFSLEISNEMIVSRMVGAEAEINPTTVMLKEVDQETEDKIFDAKATVSIHEGFMHFYDDKTQYADIAKEITDNAFDFVVIDFIQNISVSGKEEYERLSYLAHEFQALAKRKNVCLLIVSQLSNSIAKEKRDDIVEYKGSGEIGTVCDLGFYIAKGRSGENSFALQLRKSRRTVTGTSFNFVLLPPGGRIREDM